jgi:hypothetical protein
MAALSANVFPAPYYDPAFPIGERDYPVETADEFYQGAIVCHSAGLVVANNENADTGLGVCTERATTTAANETVKVAVAGIWWFACAQFDDADFWTIFGPAVGTDNPADMDAAGVGDPSGIGTLVHLDVDGTSGWLDLRQRVVVINT